MAEMKINGVGSIEEIRAAYFNQNALRQPNYRLCQVNVHGMRYYYDLNGDVCTFYPSVTTVIRNVAPENRILNEWRMALGKEAADAYTNERAEYGSMIHGFLQELLVTRRFPLDKIRDKIKTYADYHKLQEGFVDTHEQEAKEDMLSFAKWMQDYDVRPYAIEVALYHPEYKYAGMIDLVCNMRRFPLGDKKGGEERVNAICDFKTTRKDFRPEHIWQLEMYRLAWNELFPDLPIENIANVRPKDWAHTVKKEISYGFEWQTGSPEVEKVPIYLQLIPLMAEETKKLAIVSGTIDLENSLSNNVMVMQLEDIVIENSKKLPAEEETSIEGGLFDGR